MRYKQAYLIIAHKYDLTLKTLLSMIDREENDIFLHMDIKNKIYEEDNCKKLIKKSNIYFVKRTNVIWGDYSQINAELLLLKKATETYKYNYYHLLSGEDLPIQKADYIKEFFKKNYGKEFVAFDSEVYTCNERTRYFHFLQKFVGKKRMSVLGRINACLVFLQKMLHLDRNNKIKFLKGPNWFSITDELARYVLDQEAWIKRVFSYTLCCDEVFLQTIIFNSHFFDNIYSFAEEKNVEKAIFRYVDWKRGNPYVFKMNDFSHLTQTDMIFARKFDATIDEDIILNISKEYL